ncbi:hypothetical protein C7H19_13805 [Aphanothece hegewaldii CCALA 016]|uniref:RapA2 cadherin-like domain-containing protein n=1 Tax=Aphanothece hegewaldii CCALA 016 TaxID=2107694 RepID=A0A2T1LWR6_9CHRO|nr:VCBS domain-containing protein [Aphanothece hegewaldii]PSF36276.1 hypothetical protein C7H19_13805 [Aphanothece hegewaldii CCALA 016]
MLYVQLIGTANPFNGIDVGAFSTPTLADIDSDGDLDLVVGEVYGKLKYYQNTGTATNPVYTEQTGTLNPFNKIDVGFSSKPTFADIDSDGDLDAVVGEVYGKLKYYQNTGTVTNPVYTAQTGTLNPFNGIDVGGASKPALADIDSDGDLDAVIGVNDGTLYYYQNTGTVTNPVYTLQTGTLNPFNGIDVGSWSTPTLADIDSDGDFDAVIGELYGKLKYYQNTGTVTNPVYTLQTGTLNPFNGIDVGSYSTLTLADLDSDGDQDLVVGASNGILKYYINNQTPVAVNDSSTTDEDTAITTLNVLLNDSDPDAQDTLSISQVNGTAITLGSSITLSDGALLTLNADNTFTFDPNAQYNFLKLGEVSTPSFTYTISDSKGETATTTVTITINGVNDIATITGINSASVSEDDSDPDLTATGFLTVSDPDTEESFFSTTVTDVGVNLGSLSITDLGAFTYTVANSAVKYLGAGVTKTEIFNIYSIDGSATQNITITINGINTAPIATDDSATIYVNTPVVIPVSSLLSNDTDANGDILSITSISNITGGTATLSDNDTPSDPSDDFITYNPTSIGNFSLDYTLDDGQAGTDIGTLNLIVSGFLIGTKYPDTLSGSDGDDLIRGLTSNDLVSGLGGNDTLYGNDGDDTLDGNDGDDLLEASNGDDLLFGSNGNDTIYGGNGLDTIYGGDGDDLLYGRSGNNVLIGGAGNDIIYSGSQVNQIVYQQISDRGTATTGDKINQFDYTQNKLILTELFDNIGYSEIDPVTDGYLRLFQSGNSTLLQIDTDGGANSFVRMATLYNVTATNLVVGINVII